MFPPDFSPRSSRPPRGTTLELPTSYRVPVTWLRTYASAPIRWRTVRDILPPGSATEADVQALKVEVAAHKTVALATRKQKKSGIWGDGILGHGVIRSQSSKNVGTVSQYRFLVECGLSPDERSLRLADRILFRLLSRDEDPTLLFEYTKSAKGSAETASWVRGVMRQAATAALAQAGYVEDPRVRGAAHRTASEISQFLRSELAEKPFVRKGPRTVLAPGASPPTTLAVAAFAYMPSLQRERAGFIERLCAYLAKPTPKRTYVLQPDKRALKPSYQLLGDPLAADSAGRPKDLPLALHWLELLARMKMLQSSPVAQRILTRLLADCDDRGVWNPGNLRGLPKGPTGVADFTLPLEPDGKTPESRQADVTFRLALIARVAGWSLQYV